MDASLIKSFATENAQEYTPSPLSLVKPAVAIDFTVGILQF
jgi:hypothetical protein